MTNMEPTWVLAAPGGPHVGPMNFAIRVLASEVKMTTFGAAIDDNAVKVMAFPRLLRCAGLVYTC